MPMKITSKGRYAIIIMLEVALKYDVGQVSLRSLSENQNISVKFAEQIVRALCKNGLLISMRGSKGGYMLTRHPMRYTVGEILRTTEESLAPTEAAVKSGKAASDSDGVMLRLFRGLDKAVNRYIDGITLEDLVQMYREQGANDYVI